MDYIYTPYLTIQVGDNFLRNIPRNILETAPTIEAGQTANNFLDCWPLTNSVEHCAKWAETPENQAKLTALAHTIRLDYPRAVIRICRVTFSLPIKGS